MNTLTTPQPTLDPESLRKAIQEFRPNPHRVPFNSLKPFHDSIVELRAKRASYRSVAELLQQHGVKTSRARVATAGHHDRPGEQRSHTGKRKPALHVTRTAHCQRENDESRRKGRPRRFPESKKRPKIVTAAHATRGAFIQSGELPV